MTGAETLGGRIRKVRAHLSQDAFARMLDVGLKTVQRYERDENRVDASFLQKICEKFPDISPQWLLKGQGPITLDANTFPNALGSVIDEMLLCRIAEGIVEIYHHEKTALPPILLVQMASRIYGDLLAAYETREERMIGMKGMLQRVRRELMMQRPKRG